MNYLEIVGTITLGLVAVVIGFALSYNLYKLVRAVVLSADFVRWYLFQSKRYDPSYKMKHHVLGYLQMIGQMFNYDSTVTRFHKNGAVYKPFQKLK